LQRLIDYENDHDYEYDSGSSRLAHAGISPPFPAQPVAATKQQTTKAPKTTTKKKNLAKPQSTQRKQQNK
jgi:hypothetical protein